MMVTMAYGIQHAYLVKVAVGVTSNVENSAVERMIVVLFCCEVNDEIICLMMIR